MSSIITDKEVQALLNNPNPTSKTLSEDVGHRGAGKLIAKKRSNGSVEFRFKYYPNRKRPTEIAIGRYQPQRSKTKTGFTIAQARKKALEYSQQWQQGVDPKKFIEAEKERLERERKKKEAEANRATFKQLLELYVDTLRREGKSSWQQVQDSLERYVEKPFPELMAIPARDIEPEHITKILARMAEKGITTTMNRVRSFLHTAFKVAGQAYLNPVVQAEQTIDFGLRHNPVSLVPRQSSYERALDRNLLEQEILQLWNCLEDYMCSNTARFFKLLFALGGQRPNEILQAHWDCYNLSEKLLILPKEFTKNGREHTVPLNNLALEILHEQREHTGHCLYPFPRRIGNGFVPNKHIRLDCPSKSTRRLIAGTGMEHFTPRDIRRTCKTLMGKAGISKDIRDRIHNHALNDVSSRHYDRYEYLHEKQEAMDHWNIVMRAIIEPGSNVIVLPRKAS